MIKYKYIVIYIGEKGLYEWMYYFFSTIADQVKKRNKSQMWLKYFTNSNFAIFLMKTKIKH